MTESNWTGHEIAVLDAMLRGGYSGNEIGERLNRSKSAIFRCAKKHDFHSLRVPNGQRVATHLVDLEAPEDEITFVAPPPVVQVPTLAMPIPHARSCQWPLWDHQERPTQMFCGDPVEGRSYCIRHSRVAWGRRAA